MKAELQNVTGDRLKELTITKKIKAVQKDLKEKEQNLFFEQMRIDVGADEEISAVSAKDRYTVSVRRHFVVKVEGVKHE